MRPLCSKVQYAFQKFRQHSRYIEKTQPAGFPRVYWRTKLHSKNTMVHKQTTSSQWPLGQQNPERGNAAMGVLILSKKVMGVLCLFKLYSAMKLWSLTQTVMVMISQLDKRFFLVLVKEAKNLPTHILSPPHFVHDAIRGGRTMYPNCKTGKDVLRKLGSIKMH